MTPMEVGGNGGKGKKKKKIEDSSALPMVEVGKKSKTPVLEALKEKEYAWPSFF